MLAENCHSPHGEAKVRSELIAGPAFQGETVPYIICVELDENGQQKEGTGGLAERAYHRDELAANPNLRVDVEYYMANQVCPRVCLDILLFCSIEGSMCCVTGFLHWRHEPCQTKGKLCMRQSEERLTAGSCIRRRACWSLVQPTRHVQVSLVRGTEPHT